jgi:hypothetical protein
MAAPRKNPADYTARQRAAASKKAADAETSRQQELTMATKAEDIRLNETVVDYTNGADEDNAADNDEILEDKHLDPDAEYAIDKDVEEKEPDSDLGALSEPDQIVLKTEKFVTIRVNEAIKDMTYGAGNYFSFEVGPKYKVPVELARHLDVLGYVWH